ncbi:MAG: lipase family alpha/beta hydrolase, partial [Verrucomicrobiales bacterium]
GLVHPERYARTSGLFLVQPFRENKIPVVFVHGLLSSPATWVEATNALRADPILRDHYQLLYFKYPTGFPVVYSAAHLRKSLRDFQEQFDPGRRNPAMRRMIIVGHSMGGLLSSLQIRDSGDIILNKFFTRPISEIDTLSADQRKTILKLVRFESNPDIERAVFLCSPHRGSEIAESFYGRLAIRMMKFPFDVFDLTLSGVEDLATARPKERIAEIDGLTELGRTIATARPDGIKSLKPHDPFLATVLNLPISDRVTYYSILGRNDPGAPLEESTDGVVPYWSSHLKGAATEKVIDSGHSSTAKHEAIEEIRRILYLHLGKPAPPALSWPAAKNPSRSPGTRKFLRGRGPHR